MRIETNGPEQTRQAGRELASRLTAGAVVAFTGGLGAGKTAFVSGLAEGLGIAGPATSPTFTVVNEYEGGRLPLFHFDLYRLSDADELLDLGWEDYLDRGGVCAVEWSERAPEAMALADRLVLVDLSPGGDEQRRVIEITEVAR